MPTRRLVALLALATLATSCAINRLDKPAPPKNHGGRVTAATIVFVEPGEIPVRVSKSAPFGAVVVPQTLDNLDYRQAVARVRAVADVFRARSTPVLRQRLAAEGVRDGNETVIRIRPISAGVNADNGAVSITVEAAVRHANAPDAWIVTPVASNALDATYWSPVRRPGIGDTPDVDLSKLVDTVAEAVVREMRFSGWFR